MSFCFLESQKSTGDTMKTQFSFVIAWMQNEVKNRKCATCWEAVLPRERLQCGAVSSRLRVYVWLLQPNKTHPIKLPSKMGTPMKESTLLTQKSNCARWQVVVEVLQEEAAPSPSDGLHILPAFCLVMHLWSSGYDVSLTR